MRKFFQVRLLRGTVRHLLERAEDPEDCQPLEALCGAEPSAAGSRWLNGGDRLCSACASHLSDDERAEAEIPF